MKGPRASYTMYLLLTLMDAGDPKYSRATDRKLAALQAGSSSCTNLDAMGLPSSQGEAAGQVGLIIQASDQSHGGVRPSSSGELGTQASPFKAPPPSSSKLFDSKAWLAAEARVAVKQASGLSSVSIASPMVDQAHDPTYPTCSTATPAQSYPGSKQALYRDNDPTFLIHLAKGGNNEGRVRQVGCCVHASCP